MCSWQSGQVFFLATGLVCIIFRERLNHFKNNVYEKFNIKRKDERKTNVYLGIAFIIISMVLGGVAIV